MKSGAAFDRKVFLFYITSQCCQKKSAKIVLLETLFNPYMTLEHKTSHKGQFFETEMYASSES